MSVTNLLQTLGIHSVPPVPPAYSCEGTENTHEKQSRTPCTPCTPEKHRGAEKNPKRVNPDAVLLKVARQLKASPASLRAMLTDDDMQDIADGLNSPAVMLEFFRLAQKHGELLADQRQPVTPASAARLLEHRPGQTGQMKVWK